MSIELSEGLTAKTGWSYDGSETYYAELGKERRTLVEAIDEIGHVFDDPRLQDDLYFRDFRYYVQSMEPLTIDRRGEPTVVLWPDNGSFQFGEDRGGPTVELMDHSLSRNDVMSFIAYVFVNSPVDALDDPRLALIERLKSEDTIR